MNPANAAPDPLPPLGLSWGIKRSFIDYIAGLPDGSVSATAGATVSGSSLFCFSPDTSDYDPALGTGVLRFRGDVRLAGHHGMLLVRLLDPWITFTTGSGVLSISTGDGGGQDRTAVGFLSFAVINLGRSAVAGRACETAGLLAVHARSCGSHTD